MKHQPLLMLLLSAVFYYGCATPRGSTIAEKREYIHQMKTDTLEELFEKRPESKSKMDQAVGYGVFSNIGSALLISGAGNGFGVVINKESGEETFMRMFKATAGLGVGIKDFRTVMLFYDPQVLQNFVRKGWEFGSQADLAAKLGDTGGSEAVSGTLNRSMDIYQFTENGIFLRLALEGTKYWPDKKLNARIVEEQD